MPNALTVSTTADTTTGTLLGNLVTQAIIDKPIPGLSDNPTRSATAGMTLRVSQSMARDNIEDAMVDAVHTELRALAPASK